MRGPVRRRALPLVGSLALVASAACTSSHRGGLGSPASSIPASSTTRSTAQPAPTSTSAPAASTTSPGPRQPTLGSALEHPTSGVGFFSPTHNVSCQILDGAPYPKTEVYCQTGSPAASVTLQTDGTYQACQGTRCLGNPAVGTPVLAYGHVVALGSFRCESATDGVTCTASGRGFRISRSGIDPA